MSEPSVCCIMLTRDRPTLARRAVECWDKQTYENKTLLVLDTGDESCGYLGDYDGVLHHWADLSLQAWPIGKLRNEANRRSGFAKVDGFTTMLREGGMPDIFVHWDDDDWSHPSRIAEQVALLQSSGADCVGYRECLFWRDGASAGVHTIPGEAWLYQNGDKRYCIGSSLCYWRKAWESRPFSETNGPKPRVRGEDRVFIDGLNCVGTVSTLLTETDYEPRMICRIHAGNAHNYPVEEYAASGPHWKRVQQWDDYCRRIMQ